MRLPCVSSSSHKGCGNGVTVWHTTRQGTGSNAAVTACAWTRTCSWAAVGKAAQLLDPRASVCLQVVAAATAAASVLLKSMPAACRAPTLSLKYSAAHCCMPQGGKG